MPRDANGNYTLPAGNPVISGTIIESVWANTTMNDIATALTGSLSRSGLGGMTAPMRFADGTMGSPGISWTNEPSSGLYRQALNTFVFSVGNEDVLTITKDGIELADGKELIGFSIGVRVQDDEPTADPVPANGSQWFESDSGALYMRYRNPDNTFTWIRVNTAGLIAQYAPPRVVAEGSNPAPVIDVDVTDLYALDALADDVVFDAPEGTPVDGQSLVIRIKDDGTPRAITWDAIYRVIGVTLPTTTVANKYIYIGMFYNAVDVQWDVVGVRTQA